MKCPSALNLAYYLWNPLRLPQRELRKYSIQKPVSSMAARCGSQRGWDPGKASEIPTAGPHEIWRTSLIRRWCGDSQRTLLCFLNEGCTNMLRLSLLPWPIFRTRQVNDATRWAVFYTARASGKSKSVHHSDCNGFAWNFLHSKSVGPTIDGPRDAGSPQERSEPLAGANPALSLWKPCYCPKKYRQNSKAEPLFNALHTLLPTFTVLRLVVRMSRIKDEDDCIYIIYSALYAK